MVLAGQIALVKVSPASLELTLTNGDRLQTLHVSHAASSRKKGWGLANSGISKAVSKVTNKAHRWCDYPRRGDCTK
jgi:hypothetical protein